MRNRAARVRTGRWPGIVNAAVFGVALLAAGTPLSAAEAGDGHYPLYRESGSRCLTVRRLKDILPGDRVFGGPYPLEEALHVLRTRCPVPFEPSGDWFAVQREDGCWLVDRDHELEAGDLVIAGNVSRRLAERRLQETCTSHRVLGPRHVAETEPKPIPHGVPPPPAPAAGQPAAVWATTPVSWIQVYSKDPAGVRVRKVTPELEPPEGWKPLTPFVALEPSSGDAAPLAVRVQTPAHVQIPAGARDRVVLAFFEESTAHGGSVASARWHLHTPVYDAAAEGYVAELHHASVLVWVIVGGGGAIAHYGAPAAKDAWTRFRMHKIEGDHFVLHYPSPAISGETARWTLGALEEARGFLERSVEGGGAGVVYPEEPAKLDAYFITLSSPGQDTVYGLFQQGKFGGRWVDINLPSNIPGFDRRVLRQTLAHELFHFVQFPWEGYSTWRDAWVGKAKGDRFPYGWLNEALSTAVELYAVRDPDLKPTAKSPIYNSQLYNLGIKGLHLAKQGYSAGIFIDYLVHRYGREILAVTLQECKRQVDSGTARDPFVALRRAVRRRSNALGRPDPAGSDPDRLWREFAEAFLQDQPAPGVFDPRLDRRVPYQNSNPGRWVITRAEATQSWTVSVPPLSLKGPAAKIFKLVPAQRNPSGEALLNCEVRFTPEQPMPFDVVTPIHVAGRFGQRAPLPVDASLPGTLDRRTTSQSFQVHFAKGERGKLVAFNPIGLGAGAPPGSGPAKATYELTCKLHEEEPPPAPVPVSTSAIDTYIRILQRGALDLKARWDAHQPARLSQFCPDCETRYEAARAEADHLQRRIGALEDRKTRFSEEARPILRLLQAYYGGAAARSLSPEDAAKIQYLQEVTDRIGNMQDACSGMPREPFNGLSPLSIKSNWILHPSRVESYLRHAKRVPSADTVEKTLKAFHESLGAMEACEEQLARYERFWKEHRATALQYVQELGAAHPGLSR